MSVAIGNITSKNLDENGLSIKAILNSEGDDWINQLAEHIAEEMKDDCVLVKLGRFINEAYSITAIVSRETLEIKMRFIVPNEVLKKGSEFQLNYGRNVIVSKDHEIISRMNGYCLITEYPDKDMFDIQHLEEGKMVTESFFRSDGYDWIRGF